MYYIYVMHTYYMHVHLSIMCIWFTLKNVYILGGVEAENMRYVSHIWNSYLNNRITIDMCRVFGASLRNMGFESHTLSQDFA